MTISNLNKIVIIGIAISLLSGFGLGDITKDVVPDTGKCNGDKNCKKQQIIKGAVVIGVAAKLIYDMAISYSTSITKSEQEVLNRYKKKHGSLPKKNSVEVYRSSIKPGKVVKSGNKVRVVSVIEVARSNTKKNVNVMEKISIYGNEKNAGVIKSATKSVNSKAKGGGGEFTNQFVFKLPVGMPQGVYPIKSVILLDNKEVKPKNLSLQLVLRVNSPNDYQIIALNN